MDKLKLQLTTQAAQKQTELLEQALDENNQRAIGAALHNLKCELYTLEQIAKETKARRIARVKAAQS